MAVIKSGATTDQMTVDPVSKAARVTLYDTAGNALEGTGSTSEAISLSATDATVVLSMSGHNGVGFTITNMGHANNRITCEFTVDGSTWIGTTVINAATNNSLPSVSAAGTYSFRFTEGVASVRLRMSSYTSGTATGTINASYANANNIIIRSYANVLSVVNSTSAQLAAGATFTGTWEADLYWQSITAGFFADQDLTITIEQSNDGVTAHQSDVFYYKASSTGPDSSLTVSLMNNYHRVKISNTGAGATTTLFFNMYACPNILTFPRTISRSGNFKVEIPEKATYRATFSGALIATATLTLKGSATKLVKVTKFGWSESGTASTMKDVCVKKYSNIATGGGAATTITGVPMSSRYAAATAVAQIWTAAAGTQTVVGTLECFRYRPNVAADNFGTTEKIFNFDQGQRGGSAIDLIGVSEWAGIDNSAAVANSLGCVWVEWTEE